MGSSAFSATARSNSALASAVTTPPAAPIKGFAEIGAALGAVAVIGDRIAIGADRVVVAAEPRQHRRQHVPAAAVGRILLQMRFDLRHQIVERLVGVGDAGCARPAENRRAAASRARGRTPPPRSAARPAPAPPSRRRNLRFDCAGGSRCAVRGGQQAAADLDPRGLRLRGADQARGDVAIDLGELILVDGGLAAAGLRPARCGSTARARQRSPRPSSARTQTTASSSGSRVERRFHGKRRCAALHHGRQARQLTIAGAKSGPEDPQTPRQNRGRWP